MEDAHGLLFGLDAKSWAIIIGSATVGVGGIILQCMNAYFSYRRDMAKLDRDIALEKKVQAISDKSDESGSQSNDNI